MRIDLHYSAWKAHKIDKGPLQDAVLYTGFPLGRILVVVDGATGASGLEALGIVQECFNSQVAQTLPASRDEIKQFFESILYSSRQQMMERSRHCGRIAASISCACLYLNESEPKGFLCRLGDAGFIATYQSGHGEPELLSRASEYGSPTWLCSYNDLEQVRWVETDFARPGVYRIRLYSDGVHLKYDLPSGNNNEAYTEDILAASTEGIANLVSDITRWHERSDNNWVGMDDVSIAGFDVYMP